MKPIALDKFGLELLAKGEDISFCLPITAANSTVLGYEVNHRSRMWRGLDWSHVMIDNGPHMLHGSYSEYIHVQFRENGDKLRYRVRSRLEIGDKVKVMGVAKRLTVTDVTVAGFWDGHWQWRYEATPKPAREALSHRRAAKK